MADWSPRRLSRRWLRRFGLPLAALLLATGCVATAPQAQTGDVNGGDIQYIEPPGRVGQIGLLAGQVTLTDTQTGDYEAATLNWPITSGHRVSTGHDGRAEVRIGSLAVRMDSDSVVDFARIDDSAIQFVVQTGTVAVRVRNRELLPQLAVSTPREGITFEDVGRYRIDVDRVPGLTTITTHVGRARLSADSGRMVFTVQSGQRGEAASAPTTSFRLATPAADAFDDWVASRDSLDDAVASGQYASGEITGVESLQEYGTWRAVPDYGTVWFPSAVPVGWAPYRFGHWAYIAPWGWTWIDDAPWGFAPFHYGRWVHVGGHWGWYPGLYVAHPIYAPALVAWYGTPGFGVGVSIGHPVGWFPLGYGEVYIPPWRHSRRYINAINGPYVRNINNVGVVHPPPRYIYQAPGTATWAPNDAVLRHRPIQREVRPAPPDMARAPAVAAPPLRVPQGFIKRTVPAGNVAEERVRAPSGASEHVITPRVIANPPREAPAKPVAPPAAATPAPHSRGSEEHVVRPQPKSVAPQTHPSPSPVAPVRPPAVKAPAPAASQRAPEFTAPRAPAHEAPAAPRPAPAPKVTPAPRAAPPAPPSVPAPARVAPPVRAAPPPVSVPPKNVAPPQGAPREGGGQPREGGGPKVSSFPDRGRPHGNKFAREG